MTLLNIHQWNTDIDNVLTYDVRRSKVKVKKWKDLTNVFAVKLSKSILMLRIYRLKVEATRR